MILDCHLNKIGMTDSTQTNYGMVYSEKCSEVNTKKYIKQRKKNKVFVRLKDMCEYIFYMA